LRSKDFGTRWAGIRLLAETIRCCSHSVLSDHYEPWSTKIVEILRGGRGSSSSSSSEPESIITGAIAAMNLLLQRIVAFPDLRRDFLKSGLAQGYVTVLSTILNAKEQRGDGVVVMNIQKALDDQRIEGALEGLCVTLKCIGSSVRAVGSKLEEIAVPHLKHPRKSARDLASW